MAANPICPATAVAYSSDSDASPPRADAAAFFAAQLLNAASASLVFARLLRPQASVESLAMPTGG